MTVQPKTRLDPLKNDGLVGRRFTCPMMVPETSDYTRPQSNYGTPLTEPVDSFPDITERVTRAGDQS